MTDAAARDCKFEAIKTPGCLVKVYKRVWTHVKVQSSHVNLRSRVEINLDACPHDG